VVGNGDITTPQEAKTMYEETGCDLVMVGRGALGRPWLFGQIKAYLEEGILLPDPKVEDRMAVMLRHMEMICGYKTNMLACARPASTPHGTLPGCAVPPNCARPALHWNIWTMPAALPKKLSNKTLMHKKTLHRSRWGVSFCLNPICNGDPKKRTPAASENTAGDF
jgi:hypothetical protein